MTCARSAESSANVTGVMVDLDPPYGRYAPATRHPAPRGAIDVQERAGPPARRRRRQSPKMRDVQERADTSAAVAEGVSTKKPE